MIKSVLLVLTVVFSINGAFAQELSDFDSAMQEANQGNSYAAFKVASMLDNGRGVEADKAQAIKWYKTSAKLGYAQAQSMLGFKYAMGNGVTKDLKIAYAWFDIAVKNGHEISEQYRDKAAKELSASELEVAKDISIKWFKAYKSPVPVKE